MSNKLHKVVIFSLIFTLVFFVGCKKDPDPKNTAPVVSAVSVIPPSVPANGNATVTVTATDEESSALTYSYMPSGGSIVGNTASVNWTAPGTAGALSVTVTVTDGGGLTATGSGNLTVTQPVTQVTGTASFPAGVNGDLYNSKVSLYTSYNNWLNYSTIKYGATTGEGASVNFALTGVNAGNYYLDVWKDNDNNGFWSVGDFVGWYGAGGLAAPSLTEFQIAQGQTVNINVNMYIII